MFKVDKELSFKVNQIIKSSEGRTSVTNYFFKVKGKMKSAGEGSAKFSKIFFMKSARGRGSGPNLKLSRILKNKTVLQNW